MNLSDYIEMIAETAGSEAAEDELKEYYYMKNYYPDEGFYEWCRDRGIICNQNVT